MSYDILAFDPDAVTDDGFEAWWDEQGLWAEHHSYDDPRVSTPGLQAFYRDLAVEYPPLDAPEGLDPADQHVVARLTDYSFGYQLIYGAGSWSLARELAEAWERLGQEHGVVIAFVSDSPLRIVRP